MRRNNAEERRQRDPGRKKTSKPAQPGQTEKSSGNDAGLDRGNRYSSSHTNDDFCNEAEEGDGNDPNLIDNGDDDNYNDGGYYNNELTDGESRYWIPYGSYQDSYDSESYSDSVLDCYTRGKFKNNLEPRKTELDSHLAFNFHNRRHILEHNTKLETRKSFFFNEDGKEIHFLTQKLPMAASQLVYLKPFGCCNLKLQIAQTEQSLMLAVIFASCFQDSMIVPIKGCFTSRIVVACKGLRKDIVYYSGMIPALRKCFNMNKWNFRRAIQKLRDSGLIEASRIDTLEEQAQMASDEVWADDFRCSLILARCYIQAALEGKVSPAPEYLSPELADMLNKRVFSQVTDQQRSQNLEMIRTLMKSDISNQLLPLFRVVFHPDLHTWRMTLPGQKTERETKGRGDADYWQWNIPAASEFNRRRFLPQYENALCLSVQHQPFPSHRMQRERYGLL